MNCAVCGKVFSDPTVPHYCQLVKLAMEERNQPQSTEGSVQRADNLASTQPLCTPPLSKSSYKAFDSMAASHDEELGEDQIGKQENIKVIVRVRPLMSHESDQRQATQVIHQIDSTTLQVKGSEPRHKLSCRFDAVFGPQSEQAEVYSHVKECTKAVMEGFNSTVFAYGQTGSGKTHTMFGPPGHVQSLTYGVLPGLESGIIPRAIGEIFDVIETLQSASVSVYCSFVQIYNEQLFDMLRDPSRGHPLEVHEDPSDGIFVQGLSEYSVRGFHDCMELLRLGEENRAIRETHMNQASSRSHSIFQLLVEQKRIDGDSERHLKSKFNLVDLAGSEKWDLSKEMENDRVAEMTNINLSLYTLGRCIAALASKKSLSSTEHVPYRDSKLTRLLQDSLGGNAKTRVIATLSPASDCIDESVSTLKFADRAKQVMVFLRRNENRPVDFALVQRLQREIVQLRAFISELSQADDPQSLIQSADVSSATSLPAVVSEKKVIEELRRENTKLKLQLDANTSRSNTHLPTISPSKRPAYEASYVNGLENSNKQLRETIERISEITSKFFNFSIEEDELKSELTRCFGVLEHTPHTPPRHSHQPPSRTPSQTRQINANSDSSDLATRNMQQPSPSRPATLMDKKPTAAKAQSSFSPQPSGPPSVRYRVRGSKVTEVKDEAEEEEEKLAKELAKAKARMRKHLKLQEWLKKKEERELQLLQESEQAQQELEKEQKVQEKKRVHRAKKAKKRLAKYYDKLITEATGGDDESPRRDFESGDHHSESRFSNSEALLSENFDTQLPVDQYGFGV